MEEPIKVEKMNGPYAATAAVQPMTPALWRGESAKIIGYCRKVAALPMPVKRNRVSMKITKSGNWSSDVGVNNPRNAIPSVLTIRTMPVMCVRIAPPYLSATGPKRMRASEPTNGPRKAYFKGSGAPGKAP